MATLTCWITEHQVPEPMDYKADPQRTLLLKAINYDIPLYCIIIFNFVVYIRVTT